MDRQKKKTIIQSHQQHGKDTGSPQVQIMILTERILEVTAHLDAHKKDNHSRRGLLKMVETRKKLLRYLQKNKVEQYEQVVAKMEEIKAQMSAKPAKKAATKKPAAKKAEADKKTTTKKSAPKTTKSTKSKKAE